MDTEQPPPLRSLLLSSRKRAELTQEELAERSGVSVNTIGNLEADRGHLPRRATLDLLVRALVGVGTLDPGECADLRQAFSLAFRTAQAQRGAVLRASQTDGVGHRTDTSDVLVEPASPLLPPAGTRTFLVCADVRVHPRRPGPAQPPPGEPAELGVVRHIVQRNGGLLVNLLDEPETIVGVFVAVDTALAAVAALLQALYKGAEATGRAATAAADPPVCVALHTGWAQPGTGDYAGATRRRAVRLAYLGHGGQILLSQSVREQLGSALPEGLRLRVVGMHSLNAVERPQPISQLERTAIAISFPPLRPSQLPPTNLPVQPTSFIGRTPELGSVDALLAEAPLVTLVGTGGCGKTRLGLQVAAESLDNYRDGAWFVELAALSDPALVPQAVAAALKVPEEPGCPLLSTLVAALRTRRLLLVLDNCEHLVESCAALAAALLRSCPHMHVLATSRERLNIRGERVYRVPSLSLPVPGVQPAIFDLMGYEGVRLFTERARASHSTFTLTVENAQPVMHICARLDGIPLALELAAARVRTLPVAEIAARLDQCMGVLTGGARDVLPRHQTLRAALDWSWDLLGEKERVLLGRLAVFAGGWTAAAAVSVCADLHAPVGQRNGAFERVARGIEAREVPALLEMLEEKSLIGTDQMDGSPIGTAAAHGKQRYVLLETVRQYAQERLVSAGGVQMLRDRHMAWCLALAEEAEPMLTGSEQHVWLARLETEHDNMRAALGWAREHVDGERGLRLATALHRFWNVRNYFTEGRAWLESALTSDGAAGASNAVRAAACNAAGILAHSQADYTRTIALFEDALVLYRALGDRRGVAAALNGLGNVAYRKCDYPRATALHEQALVLRRGIGDVRAVAASLSNLGISVSLQGDRVRPTALFEEALVLQRASGDAWSIAASLSNLGLALDDVGDHARAEVVHTEALALRRKLGDMHGVAISLRNLGHLVYEEGDHTRATALLEESLALRRALGDKLGVADSLDFLGKAAYRAGEYGLAATLLREGLRLCHELGTADIAVVILGTLASVCSARGQLYESTQLSGAAHALRQSIGVQMLPEHGDLHEASLQVARDALGEQHFAAAWQQGLVLSLEQATALVPAE